jgi:hypothetical protein
MRGVGSERASQDDSTTVAPLHVRRAGRVMLWFGFALPLAIYAVVVMLAPLDVLDRFPWMREAADGIHGWLLTQSSAIDIYRHARSTAFPQVAMLASALGVCIAFGMALATFVQTGLFFKHLAPLLRLSIRTAKDRIGGLVALPVVGSFCLWAFYCIKGDWSFASGLTTQSRVGYVLISSISVTLAGGGIGLWVMQARLLVSDIFLGRDHE